jgi:lactate dehydrogenase-like 2-hydroxyacid dehydrogenase
MMAGEKRDVLLIGARKPVLVKGLEPAVNLHYLLEAKDQDAFIKDVGPKIGAIALAYTSNKVDGTFLTRFPKLEQISSFGVGYDHVDAKWAGAHGIVVTNTPDVLNEEVADTALGLLLCTVREFPQAERYVRAGKWPKAQYPLAKATLRDRTVGMVGMGRIGKAIARRLEAFGVPVVYHSRNPQDVTYKYYPKLLDMARDVDTLMVIVPGGPATQNLINADVLKALGPRGIVINMARGSVVDEPALIEALKNRTIYSAGLDVFAKEPEVPKELLEMDHIVLFPHLGSSTEVTAWAAGKPPLTPVPETPYPPKR